MLMDFELFFFFGNKCKGNLKNLQEVKVYNLPFHLSTNTIIDGNAYSDTLF
jgi:hypothetical protein